MDLHVDSKQCFANIRMIDQNLISFYVPKSSRHEFTFHRDSKILVGKFRFFFEKFINVFPGVDCIKMTKNSWWNWPVEVHKDPDIKIERSFLVCFTRKTSRRPPGGAIVNLSIQWNFMFTKRSKICPIKMLLRSTRCTCFKQFEIK